MKQQNKRRLIVGAQGLTLGAIVAGTAGFVAADKSVELVVDGQSRTVQTFGSDVSSVLRAAKVTVTAEDEVSPSLDASVSDGSSVQVRLAKPVSVTVDGKQRTVNTTAQTVGELAEDLGLESGSKLSLANDLELASAQAPLSVTTPKTVRVMLAGQEREVTTTGLDVASVLKQLGASVDEDDRVSPAANTVVTDGMNIDYTQVSTSTKKVTSSIDFSTTKLDDSSLEKGKTKTTTAGREGQRVQVYDVVTENGKPVGKRLVSDKVTKAPVNAVLAVGSKDADSSSSDSSDSGKGTSAAGPSSGVWNALAKCESGGNWGINTGNGYYGGLQFTASTWRAQGGTKYAALPHQATPAQQIEIATKLQKRAGWGQWPACTSKLGLR